MTIMVTKAMFIYTFPSNWKKILLASTSQKVDVVYFPICDIETKNFSKFNKHSRQISFVNFLLWTILNVK